jgi:hypothetical protein
MPSRLDLERDLRAKLSRYSRRSFTWKRLAVEPTDFSTFRLFPLEPKERDARTKCFLELGHTQCAELDAIPADELRRRVEQAITTHIPSGEWEYLLDIERYEREQWQEVLKMMNA